MAGAKEDRLDSAVTTLLTAVVVAILIAYFAIPVIMSAIGTLTGDAAQYAQLFELTLTLMIVSIVVLIVRGFSRGGRR